MGLIDDLTGRLAYLDTNIFIYAVEGGTRFDVMLGRYFERLADRLERAITSELTLAEVLVKPFQDHSLSRQQAFNDAIQTQDGLSVSPVTRTVLIEAARVRATTTPRLKLPDAIHVATALEHGCEVLLTNDHRIRTVPGLDVRYLDDYASP